MRAALHRRLVGKTAARQLQQLLEAHLPQLEAPDSARDWKHRATRVRKQMLELFFRGHAEGLLDAKPRVVWGDTIETDKGYRIRKLRYEGYPGLWVPALLYEPTQLRGRVPAVLNPNGHHMGGKSMDYKQARCINLAKRGALALNSEFIGMGELRADIDHNRIGALDLCGTAGIGVFYLVMKRALDVLLNHPHADPQRVAMTGLSGGGWQTAILSALDERVRAIVPVAGYSALWQRRNCIEDIGDLEQCPSDMAAVADYDVLTGLYAPRPTLLIYNRHDDCCFQTKRARRSIFLPGRSVYSALGAGDALALYDNTEPGTHNYEADNRRQLYAFLKTHFDLEGPEDDLPWRDELRNERELNVGLPPDNATLYALAQDALQRACSERKQHRTAAAARSHLSRLIALPRWTTTRAQTVGARRQHAAYTVRQHRLQLDDQWTLPIVEIAPKRASGTELIVADAGRSSCQAAVESALKAGRRALVADVFGTGELAVGWQHHMLVAATGLRPLGLQVGHLLALMKWAGRRYGTPHLSARGQIVSIAALIACALQPQAARALVTFNLLDSLARLVQWPTPYAAAPSLFCFGLLSAFDVEDLIELSAPMPLSDGGNGRGPLR